LLDTGGGLKKAAWFFLEDSIDPQEPLHRAQRRCHQHNRSRAHGAISHENQALATLAVQDRETSRYFSSTRSFSFAAADRDAMRSSPKWSAFGAARLQPLAFFRHPRHFSAPACDDDRRRRFSIIASYLRLAAQGEKILAFRADEYYWRDLGRPEDLSQAAGFKASYRPVGSARAPLATDTLKTDIEIPETAPHCRPLSTRRKSPKPSERTRFSRMSPSPFLKAIASA
jgi:hypothetical protein